MTIVIRNAGLSIALLCALAGSLFSQSLEPGHAPGPAEALYLQLRSVGLDKNRVYKIREAALDRSSIHLSMDDGTIAFTADAGGHVTGALFLGDGDILLSPPNAAERSSLALFTGAAILEEKFSLAYLRFNDDVYETLRPSLRPPDDPDAFVTLWNPTAKELAHEDALRLLVSFTQGVDGQPQPTDRLFHAYLKGQRLGSFDVRYDSTLLEQISAGQHRAEVGNNFYDLWASFAPALAKAGIDRSPPPAPDFEISQFKVQAQIKLPTDLAAQATLTITPQRSGPRVLLFELSRLLQVRRVEADGQPVEFIHNQAIEGSQLARRGNDAMAVFLSGPLQAAKPVQLTFEYSGSVLSEAANGLLFVGERGTWYPNIGLEMSRFDLEFRYPIGWTLVATGKPAETRVDRGEQLSRWISERPVPLAGFNLGKYSRSSTRAGNVTVETYATATVERSFPKPPATATLVPNPGPRPGFSVVPQAPSLPPSPSQNAQMVGAAAAQALDFYQTRFGPYPYSSLALTQFPGPVSQGWPGLVFLSSYSFLTPEEREHIENNPAVRLLQEQIVPHETAHQWWGDLVTWNSYRDQWIMEALANYSALLLLESRNPKSFRMVMQKYRDDLLSRTESGAPVMNAGPVTFGLRLSSSQFPNAYETISYGRGTWLLHMLRTMLRDSQGKAGAGKNQEDPFVGVLRKLRAEYEGKPLTTSEFLAAFETVLPRSLWYEGRPALDWFYQGWLNGSAVPEFELHDLKFSDKPSSTLVTGKIVQKEAPDSLVTAVPLYASVAGKNIFLGRVFAEGSETTFHISAPLHVRKIVLDPEQTLLARNK